MSAADDAALKVRSVRVLADIVARALPHLAESLREAGDEELAATVLGYTVGVEKIAALYSRGAK